MKKNIFISGTDGCVGSHLKKYFIHKGYQVFGTVFFKDPKEYEIKLDIRNEHEFIKLPDRNFEIVIHTVGIVDQTKKKDHIFAVNVKGTANMLKWSKEKGCSHFIQMSSISVYGLKTMGQNRNEENIKRYNGRFVIPYMRSKAKAERLIEESGIGYTILRLPPVIGKRDSTMSRTIIESLKKNQFFICGNDNKKVSLLYVKNLGPVMEKLIQKGPFNDFFNSICEDAPWMEIVTEYAKNLGIQHLSPAKKSPFSILTHLNDKDYLLLATFSKWGSQFSCDKLKNSLELELEFSWREGVKESVDDYLSKNNL